MTSSNWSSDETITITTDNMDESGFVYSIDSSTISDITTASIDTSAFDDLITLDGDITLNIDTNTFDPKEFEDVMPSVAKVEDMCMDYPALKMAYDNFKTIYSMVHQDWVGRQEDNDPLPF
jgi:hypothetical protein